MKYLLLIALLLSCTKKEETPKEVLDLISSYKKAQEEVTKLDADLKKAGSDEGAQIKINYDMALAKSRLERLKVILKHKSPESVPEEAPAGGGHGGGH